MGKPRITVDRAQGRLHIATRLSRGPILQMLHEFQPELATDLAGRWESYRVFSAPVNWRFRSGDRFEFNVNPTGPSPRPPGPWQLMHWTR